MMSDTSASANHQSHSSALPTASTSSASGNKIVSMKLFASWEVDKTSSSCIPRLCLFKLTNFKMVSRQLENEDTHTVVIAVKMDGSKRVLRSGEIHLNPQTSETPLDISFSMQYAHFLKRDVNNLRVLLQRKKKYKNRTFLGYKTLAMGTINLSQVLQSPKDSDLELKSPLSKEKHRLIAVVSLHNITSKPVTYDDGKTVNLSGTDRSPESDDDDDDMLDEDLSADDSCTDEDVPQIASRSESNFKQKIIRLLKRFKSSDDAEKHILTVLERGESVQGHTDTASLNQLFDELEALSEESENEQDNISIMSTPKPSLPVFFSKTSSLDTMKQQSPTNSERGSNSSPTVEGCDHMHESASYNLAVDDVFNTDLSSPMLEHSESEKLHESLMFTKVFRSSSKELPDVLYLVDQRPSISHHTLAHICYQSLQKISHLNVFRISEKDIFEELLRQMSSAIQSFCNNNSRTPVPIKIALLGNDSFFNQFIEKFVKIFSEKPSDWLNNIKVIPIPIGPSHLCKQIALIDTLYHQTFSNEGAWQRLTEKASQSVFISGDHAELADRIEKYVSSANSIISYPICEAMVTHRGASKDQHDSQLFIPFLTEVYIGNSPSSGSSSNTAPQSIPGSLDADDISSMYSTSPTYKENLSSSLNEKQNHSPSSSATPSPPGSAGNDPCELQIDYWSSVKTSDKSKAFNKDTLKGYFKFIKIEREKSTFRLTAVNREKRGKMIRLGKKSKDKSRDRETDNKSTNINKDSITRIVCTAKDSSDSLNIFIDQTEYQGVRYFQLSTQWQTHVKHLPIAVSKPCHAPD